MLTVETPRIIEVEIPILIYKYKEMVVKYEESDLFNNIDDIIHRYSQPYEEIYSMAFEGKEPGE
jgi:hypothetical protein